MMIRVFLFLLVSASLTLRGSEPISMPYSGATAIVKQPHVTAELIPETAEYVIGKNGMGKNFDVILHLHSDPGWHTYWINPGDAGLATTIKWTLPPGFTVGATQWPTPEKHNMGPLVTYGYESDVYLVITIYAPTEPTGPPADHVEIKAKASWLVCQEECIPGKGDFSLTYKTVTEDSKPPFDNQKFFDEARSRLPVSNAFWNVNAYYSASHFILNFYSKSGVSFTGTHDGYFFPEQPNVLAVKQDDVAMSNFSEEPSFGIRFDAQQNGEKPAQLSGVLVSEVPFIDQVKAVYIAPFNVDYTKGGSDDGKAQSQASAEAEAPGTHRPSEQGEGGMMAASAKAQPWLIGVLGAAFIGGLILNLMPCVLPVLSLKVFSLIKHAEGDPRGAWKQGAAFTAGVVLSFWLLAGVLLALRAAGNHLGWGFQMQSPGFVLALIFIFFLLGLNLFGVFELGTSLVGLDAKVTGKSQGLISSFLNGALATLAATPCTAPFMGSALGFAAQQSAFISMLIFTFLAFGMAAPYLLLTIFPGALKFVPKPGAWMEAFKQFMGFLLMATVIFLLYVFGALVEQLAVYVLMFALLTASIGAWNYGRNQRAGVSLYQQWISNLAFMGVAFLIASNAVTPVHSTVTPSKYATSSQTSDGWQPWSQDAVKKALADGKPVFVDFTAAWCLSCKVNERVALDTDTVRKAFADKGVVLFKADWTHADPEISKALQQYNRDGVPLYLLYSPKQPDQPQILPEVLTPSIVLDALNKL